MDLIITIVTVVRNVNQVLQERQSETKQDNLSRRCFDECKTEKKEESRETVTRPDDFRDHYHAASSFEEKAGFSRDSLAP